MSIQGKGKTDFRQKAHWSEDDDIDFVDEIDIRNLVMTAGGRHMENASDVELSEQFDRETPLSSIFR